MDAKTLERMAARAEAGGDADGAARLRRMAAAYGASVSTTTPTTPPTAPVPTPIPEQVAPTPAPTYEMTPQTYETLLGIPKAVGGSDLLNLAVQAYQREMDKGLQQRTQSIEETQAKAEKAKQKVLSTASTAAGEKYSPAGLPPAVALAGPLAAPLTSGSRMIRGMPGYVLDETTNKPREATNLELLTEPFTRQTIYEGPEAEARKAKLLAEKEAKYQAARAAGKTEDEARQEAEPLITGTLTAVEPNRIVETRLMAAMRDLGMSEAVLGEFVFDTLPLFYEVDAQGNLQHPDEYGDRIAKAADDWLKANAPSYANQPFIFGSTKTVIPRPFQAIDRDTPTTLPDAGERTAVYTPRALADISTSVARGRSMGDEFFSVPAYRDALGENYGTGLTAALITGFFIPNSPIPGFGAIADAAKVGEDVGKAIKSAKVAEAAAAVGKAAETGAALTSPTRWGKAYKLATATNELAAATGGKPVSVTEALLSQGDVAKRGADLLAQELVAPASIRVMANEGVAAEEVLGFANNSKSGQHIMRMAGIAPDATGALSPEQVKAIETATKEWRLGAEANTLASAFTGPNAKALTRQVLSAPDVAIRKVVGDLVGNSDDAIRGTRYAQILEDLRRVAQAEGEVSVGQFDEAMKQWQKLAKESGSMPMPIGNKYLRSAIAFVDQVENVAIRAHTPGGDPTEAGSARALIETSYRSPLTPAFKVSKAVAQNVPATSPHTYLTLALHRAVSDGAEDVIRNMVPKDMVFVTDRLMVPRSMVTEQAVEDAGQLVAAAIPKSAYAVENGLHTVPSKIIRDALDTTDRLPRSGFWQGAKESLFLRELGLKATEGATAQLTPEEFAWVADTLSEGAWRATLGEEAVRTPIFKGRQVEAALAPQEAGAPVRRSLGQIVDDYTDVVEAVELSLRKTLTTTVGGFKPQDVKRAEGLAISGIVSDWRKSFKIDLTPAAVQKTMGDINNLIAPIPERFQTELLADAKKARAAGMANPGEVALNAALLRRWNSIGDDAVAALDEQVRIFDTRDLPAGLPDIELKGVPTEAQVYAIVAYQMRGINEVEGTATTMQLGQRIAAIGKMTAEQQAKFISVTKKAFRDQAYMVEWRRILENYFIGTLFGKTIDPNANQLQQDISISLGKFVRDAKAQEALENLRAAQAANAPSPTLYALHDLVVNAGVMAPTPANFEVVVKRMKDSSEELGKRGAASWSLLSREWRTGSFETLSAWAMGVDKTKIVNDQLRIMFDMNPAVRLDLLPSQSARTQVFNDKVTMAKLTVAQDVVDAMAKFYKRITKKELAPELIAAARAEAMQPSGVMGVQAAERLTPTKLYAAEPAGVRAQSRIAQKLARETAKAEKATSYADSLKETVSKLDAEISKLNARKNDIINFTGAPARKAQAEQLWRDVAAAKTAAEDAERIATADREALSQAKAQRTAYREATKAARAAPDSSAVDALQSRIKSIEVQLADAQEAVAEMDALRAKFNKAKGKSQRSALAAMDAYAVAKGTDFGSYYKEQSDLVQRGQSVLDQLRGELKAAQAAPPRPGPVPKGVSNADLKVLLDKAKASRSQAKKLAAELKPLEARKAKFISLIAEKVNPIAAQVKKLSDAKFKVAEKLRNASSKAASAQASVAAPLVRTVIPSVERPVMVPIIADIDRYVDLRLRSLGVEERGQIMEDIVGRMVADGTLYPNMRSLRANTSVRTAGNRATLAAEARGGIGRLLESKGPKADTALHNLVYTVAQEMKRLQVPQDKLVDAVVNAVDARMSDVVSSGLIEDIRDVMRGYGFSTMHNVSEGTKAELLGGFLGVDLNSPTVVAVGRDMVESLKKLELQAANGELVSKLERLQTQNIMASGNAAQLAMYLTLEGLAFLKSTAQSGLLAAGTAVQLLPLPLIPNGRYLGVNILTNPLIMLATVGPKRAAQAAEFAVGERASRLVDVVTRRPATVPMFVDVKGRPWMQADLEAAFLRNNITTTTADMNQAADFFESLKSDLRILSQSEGLKEMGWFRSNVLNQLDPTQSNIFQRFAVDCDMTMRKATFATAIRDGMTEQQAAKLAREATLDYGNIPDAVKTYANRYILFAAFQMASTKAMLEALANDPTTFIRVARLQMRQQQAVGNWYYGDDSNRVRMFVDATKTGPETDNMPAFIAGPQNPILSSYWQLISVLGWGSELFGPPSVDLASRGVEGVMEAQLQPVAQAALGVISSPGEGAIGRLVPDDWVSLLKTYPAAWEMMKAQCDIEEVPIEKRRPGTPTFEGTPGVQYQFTSKSGYRAWQMWMLAATQARVGRASSDFEKTLIAGGMGEEGYNPKYRALANPFLYAVGAQTPVRGVTPEEIQRRALQTVEREVR